MTDTRPAAVNAPVSRMAATRRAFWWFVEHALGATFVVLWLSVIAWYMLFRYDDGEDHGVGSHPEDSIDCFYVRDGDDC